MNRTTLRVPLLARPLARLTRVGLGVLFALAIGCGGAEPLPPAPAPLPAAHGTGAPSAALAAFVDAAPLDVDPTAAPLSEAGMTRHCDATLRRAELIWEGVRRLASEKDDRLEWRTTMGALDAAYLAMRSAGDYAELIAVAHADAKVREAAQACAPKVDRLLTTVLLDDATAQVVRRYSEKPAPAGARRFEATSDAEEALRARYVARILTELRRNGASLDAAGKARLRELSDRISKATQEFTANLSNATSFLEIDPKSLEGLPAAYVEKHPKQESGKVRISTDYPDYFPFMQYAKDRRAALELHTLFDNRAADKNVPLLQEILRLRSEKARLLGYATWADFVLEMRMAKNPATVATFLEDLRKHLAPIVKREMAELASAHKRLGGGGGGGGGKTDDIPPSDRLYLEEVVRKAKYGVDSKEVSEYFEVERVTKGLLDITSELFGITYRPTNAPGWHPDVRWLEVLDGDRVIGRFAMDLFPRPGKYKHAAVFTIRETRKMEDGSRLMPIAAVVCNFPRTEGGVPGLLSHVEVSTFFHEFGHVLHAVLSTAELTTFAGTNVARDFVEAPSQMLEEWTWSKPVLDRFALHHETGKPIPAALFAKMEKGRAFGRAVGTQRQLFLSSLDQAYHAVAEPPADTTATVREVWKKTMPFRYLEGTHFQATFGHLMQYDAGYYGYQWALAIARDLFSRFEKEGLMKSQAAIDYRKKVIEPGSSEDEGKLVESFLGRPFSREPYKRFLAQGR